MPWLITTSSALKRLRENNRQQKMQKQKFHVENLSKFKST